MKPVWSEIDTQRLLTLVNSALHGTNPDESLFVNAEENDWNKLFELSTAQGIIVLAFNGIMQLPKEMQPPLPVKLRWIASAEAVEKSYLHRLETAKELHSIFKENNIRMLLFKGVALSRLYPVPASREFGDIDIFLHGKSKEGNAVLERITGEKDKYSKKHSSFLFRKVLIENHHTFLNHNSYMSFQNSRNLEKRLMAMVEENGIYPSPDFDALFVTLHTLTHLSSRIVLRQLCDLTVIFTAYKGKLNFSLYQDALEEAGLLKLAGMLISLCTRHLGLNPEYVPSYSSDVLMENRIWNNILNPEIPPLPKGDRSLITVFFHKIKLLRSKKWKYELVFPGKYWRSIIYSVFFHLRYPETIAKSFHL